jgi:hypothetical protein
VQLFCTFVTVTVYVPPTLTTGLCAGELKPAGPLHKYVAADAFVLTCSTTVESTHVNTPPVALTCGASVLPVTCAVALAVHPLTKLVTTTVYTPGKEASGLGMFALLKPAVGVHEKVEFGTLDVACNCACELPQPKKPPTALTCGGVVFAVITTVSVFTHCEPPATAVTVKITMPGALTLTVLPVPNTTPFPSRHTFVPGDGAEPNVTTGVEHVSTPPPVICATGSTTVIEKVIKLSQPW